MLAFMHASEYVLVGAFTYANDTVHVHSFKCLCVYACIICVYGSAI